MTLDLGSPAVARDLGEPGLDTRDLLSLDTREPGEEWMVQRGFA